MALKTSTKTILGIAGAILILVLGIAGYGAWRIYFMFSEISSYTNRQVPPELAEPRVLTGEGFLEKKEILKKTSKSLSEIVLSGAGQSDDDRERLGSIETAKSIYGFSDLAVCGNDVVAAGKFGAYLTDLDGKAERFIVFEPLVDEIKVLFWTKKTFRETTDELQIFDIEGDGKCEYHSNSSADGFSLFDSNGKVRWRYRNLGIREYLDRGTNDSRGMVRDVGNLDLDRDGRQDLLVLLSGEGLRAFTAEQKEIWFRSGDVLSTKFQMADIDDDGKDDLVNVIGVGSELMEASTGKFIKELPLPSSTDGLIKIGTTGGKAKYRLAGMSEGKFEVYDLSGKTIFTADAPLSEVKAVSPKDYGSFTSDTENIYQPLVRAVSLKLDQEAYFVVLGTYIGIPRSQLYVYDSKGNLVYHEMLGEEAEAMTVLTEKQGREGFVVAGKDTVWRYSAN